MLYNELFLLLLNAPTAETPPHPGQRPRWRRIKAMQAGRTFSQVELTTLVEIGEWGGVGSREEEKPESLVSA